jgi:hypothetical protein
MEPLEKIKEGEHVPMLTRAWEHNGEILGIDLEGALVVVARLRPAEGTEARAGGSSRAPGARKKPGPRRRPGASSPPGEGRSASAEPEGES